MKSILINKFIYKTLSDNIPDVTIGNIILPEDSTLPAIVFEKNQHTINYNKECGEHLLNISFIVLADTYPKSLELTNKIIELFQDNKGVFDGVRIIYIRVKSIDETFDDNTFLQRIDFEIKIFE